MANDNIYDIILSEEVARKDSGSGLGGDGQTKLNIQMNTPALIALNVPIPNPIEIVSDIINMPNLWEITPNSHTIYFDLGGGFVAQPGAGSLIIQTNTDANGGTSGSAPGTIERKYFSEIKIREIATPSNELTYVSDILSITTVTSIYYGFSATDPVTTGDLSNSVLSVSDILSVASNNSFENFYILVPDTLTVMAIADEHGLITDILEWTPTVLPPVIPGFITYKFKWPIKFTGGYLHNFTLIYS